MADPVRAFSMAPLREGGSAMREGEKSIVQRSLDEHEGIKIQLDKLQELASSVREKRCEMGELFAVLEAHLDKLIPLLEQHFALEETAGLHAEIVDALPGESRRVRQLLEEHRSLLRLFGEVRGVTALIRSMVRSEEPLVHDRITKLLRLMRVHESEEHELFLRAMEGDGSAPD
jgi:septation ring formation regulator EzrA